MTASVPIRQQLLDYNHSQDLQLRALADLGTLNLWSKAFKSHRPFAVDFEDMEIQNDRLNGANPYIDFEAPVHGDLFNGVYFQYQLPKLNQPGAHERGICYWKNAVGLEMIKKAEIYSEGRLLDQVDSMYMYLHHQTHGYQSDEGVGIFDNVTIPELAQMACNGMTVTVRIPFFFCRDDLNYLPLHNVREACSKLKIRLHLKPLQELIVNLQVDEDISPNDVKYHHEKMNCFGRVVFFPQKDRAQFQRRRDYLVTISTAMDEFGTSFKNGEIRTDFTVSGAVKNLIFSIGDDNREKVEDASIESLTPFEENDVRKLVGKFAGAETLLQGVEELVSESLTLKSFTYDFAQFVNSQNTYGAVNLPTMNEQWEYRWAYSDSYIHSFPWERNPVSNGNFYDPSDVPNFGISTDNFKSYGALIEGDFESRGISVYSENESGIHDHAVMEMTNNPLIIYKEPRQDNNDNFAIYLGFTPYVIFSGDFSPSQLNDNQILACLSPMSHVEDQLHAEIQIIYISSIQGIRVELFDPKAKYGENGENEGTPPNYNGKNLGYQADMPDRVGRLAWAQIPNCFYRDTLRRVDLAVFFNQNTKKMSFFVQFEGTTQSVKNVSYDPETNDPNFPNSYDSTVDDNFSWPDGRQINDITLSKLSIGARSIREGDIMQYTETNVPKEHTKVRGRYHDLHIFKTYDLGEGSFNSFVNKVKQRLIIQNPPGTITNASHSFGFGGYMSVENHNNIYQSVVLDVETNLSGEIEAIFTMSNNPLEFVQCRIFGMAGQSFSSEYNTDIIWPYWENYQSEFSNFQLITTKTTWDRESNEMIALKFDAGNNQYSKFVFMFDEGSVKWTKPFNYTGFAFIYNDNKIYSNTELYKRSVANQEGTIIKVKDYNSFREIPYLSTWTNNQAEDDNTSQIYVTSKVDNAYDDIKFRADLGTFYQDFLLPDWDEQIGGVTGINSTRRSGWLGRHKFQQVLKSSSSIREYRKDGENNSLMIPGDRFEFRAIDSTNGLNIEPLKKIVLKIDGKNRFPDTFCPYHFKSRQFNRIPRNGIYTYSFAKFPSIHQMNGHYNFKLEKDNELEVYTNSTNSSTFFMYVEKFNVLTTDSKTFAIKYL